MHERNSKYKGEVLMCRCFKDYWIDLRSDESFVQYLAKSRTRVHSMRVRWQTNVPLCLNRTMYFLKTLNLVISGETLKVSVLNYLKILKLKWVHDFPQNKHNYCTFLSIISKESLFDFLFFNKIFCYLKDQYLQKWVAKYFKFFC